MVGTPSSNRMWLKCGKKQGFSNVFNWYFVVKNHSQLISLLPTLSKIMERIVYEQIQKYLFENDLNTVYWHAYKKGNSTTTADDWWLDERKVVGAVLLDLSAAFDILDHKLLLNELSCYSFEASAAAWINSYLTNRKYTVHFNSSYSEVRAASCGVPQGSC